MLLGHVVDMLCIRRELLAVLCHAYVFVGHGGKEVRRLPQEVINEVLVTRDVLVLAYADLGRELNSKFYCSDASGVGFAVHRAEISPEDFWAVAGF